MIFVAAQQLSGIAWTPLRYLTFHFRHRRSSVTEIAPPQRFLCVNRSPIRYAAQKLSRIVWTPLRHLTFHFRHRRGAAQRSFAPSQKSPCLMCKRVETFLPYLMAFRTCIPTGKPESFLYLMFFYYYYFSMKSSVVYAALCAFVRFNQVWYKLTEL